VTSELLRNPGWRDRLKILFGPTTYVPPVHVPYLVKADADHATKVTASFSGRLGQAPTYVATIAHE
jgi:hypothetical protein